VVMANVNGFNAIEGGRGEGGFEEGKSRRKHYGFDSASEARKWAARHSEAAGFSCGMVGLRRCRRRAMTCWAHLSARRGEGQMQLSAWALSCGGGGNQVGHQRSTQACWAR
jgi:hypothetical protein